MLPRILKFKINKKTTALLFAFVAVVLFLFVSFTPVLAQTSTDIFGLKPIEENIGLSGTDIRLIIARIIRVLLGFLGVIAISLITYAGYIIMTSEGNEEKVSQGKKILTNAIIGLAIILSAFAIVQFVINSLMRATGMTGDESANVRKKEYFYGSGALGRTIKDHYPFRDQTGVKRNTIIAVTFAEPIDPASFTENTNRTCWPKDGTDVPALIDVGSGENCLRDEQGDIIEYYADCIKDNNGVQICDRLIYDAITDVEDLPIMIYKATSTPINRLTKSEFVNRVVTTRYQDGAKRNAYTFTFRRLPGEYLGSETEDVWYTVHLTDKILKKQKIDDNPVSIFGSQFSQYYAWNFQTDTNIDFDPPFVIRIKPLEGDAIAKNIIVRVDFNEPVDPTSAQGVLSPSSSFTNVIFNSTTVRGEWRISNGYRSIEFIPSEQCGFNSCGNPMYCLPVVCANPADEKCVNDYQLLVRTAELINPTSTKSFEGDAFTGVTDMASNALDNGYKMVSDNIIAEPHKPGILPGMDLRTLNMGNGRDDKGEDWYDNFWRNFVVKNVIDRTIPVVGKVNPPVDTEEVKGNSLLQIYFTKEMLYFSLNNIFLEEYPVCVVDCPDLIWFAPRHDSFLNANKEFNTLTTILHRQFGPNDADNYYFPSIPSTVQSDNQQCLYPGRGPRNPEFDKGTQYICDYLTDKDGHKVPGTGTHCVPWEENYEEETDTGCSQTTADNFLLQPNVQTCTTTLMDRCVSPTSLDVFDGPGAVEC